MKINQVAELVGGEIVGYTEMLNEATGKNIKSRGFDAF